MCTITWKLEKNSYDIFFNRDELRVRAQAERPELFVKDGLSTVYPIDPDGSGTWIFINNLGLSAALLNYNIHMKDKDYKSRGTLLTDICFEQSRENMLRKVQSKDLQNYRGFTLCLFESGTEPYLYRWNGKEMLQLEVNQPITSSSVQLEEVKFSRESLYQKMITESGDNRKTHLDYHQSHHPEKSFLSTCMHREDAETVSFSHLYCDREKIEFTYTGNSPCINSDKEKMSIKRYFPTIQL